MHKIKDDLAEGRMESNRADGRMESEEYKLGQRPNAVSAAGNLAPKRSIPILRSNYQPCEPFTIASHYFVICPGHANVAFGWVDTHSVPSPYGAPIREAPATPEALHHVAGLYHVAARP